jgi:stress response protein YsnF
MAELQEFGVRLSSGLKGTVLRTSRFLDKRGFNTVNFSNGTEITVPSATLEPQQDGSFYLRDDQASVRAQLPNGSRASVRDTPPEDEANIDVSPFKEEVDVQRVPVNRVLDAPAESRIEDGVAIIPVMEERLKVEKQLILREEIRIVKKRTSVRDPRLISLGKNRGDVSSHNEPER